MNDEQGFAYLLFITTLISSATVVAMAIVTFWVYL